MNRVAWLGSACVLFCSVGVAANAPLTGRRVGEVLDELRRDGLTFIYNTQLVGGDMRVGAEPRARDGVELAREILAEHGLALSRVTPNVFSVVRQPAGMQTQPRTTPQQSAMGRSQTLEEVIVQTSRYTLALDTAGSHAFLTQDQVQSLPRLADETLRAVQRLPGIAVNGFSSLGPARGGEPNETAIILDGLRLYEPFHLKNFLSPVSLLDSRLIAGLDVYSGGYPAVYGDRMSAIIEAHSVHPSSQRAGERYYELGLSLFHLNGLASTAFADGKGHALIAARRSNLGELVQFSENDFGEPSYSDSFLRIDYDFGAATRGAVNALISRDRIAAIKGAGTQRANVEYRNSYVWATLERDWSDRLSSRVIASFTDVTNERHGRVADPGRRNGTVSDERAFHVAGLRVDNALATDRIDHRFGGEVRYLTAAYDYASMVHFEPGFPFPGSPAFDVTRTAAPEPHGYETGLFWDGRADLDAHWTLQAGVRFDTQTYDGSGDAAQWSPRLSVLCKLSPTTRLRASWGRFFQSQGINELQVEDGVDRFYPVQHADHAIVSVEHAFAGGFDLRIEAYRKHYRRVNPHFENLFDPLVLLPEVEFDRVRVAPDSARADGVELLLNWRPGSEWSGWFGYSWSRAEDRIDGRNVTRSWDQTHAIGIGLAWTRGPWSATLANQYHTGWPTTRLLLTQPAPPGDAPLVATGARNADRFEAYDSLDLRVTRSFALSRGELDVFIEASNMTARKNPCCTEYSVRSEEDGTYVLEAQRDYWLPLVPSLGVLWRY